MNRRQRIAWATPSLAAILLSGGCRDRSVEIAREAADRQAAQNARMIELQRDVSQGAEELVAADAAPRPAGGPLPAPSRTRRADGPVPLEAERRRLAEERRTATTLATAFRDGGFP